jgi:hypothetical protein
MSADAKLSELLSFRVTPTQFERLKARAARARIPVSALIRDLLVEAAIVRREHARPRAPMTEQVSVKVTADQAALLKQATDGEDFSEWARTALFA